MAKKAKGPKGLVKNGAALFKKYGAALASEILVEDEDLIKIPTSILAFNHQIGGGLGYGKILEIFGEESSGKSLLAYDFARSTIALGGMVILIDAEHSMDRFWAEANGLDLSKVIIYRESAIEKISDFIADSALYYRSQLVNNEPILIITDSVAALDVLTNKNSDHEKGKAEMGNRAKQIDKFLRIRHELLYDLGIASIFINQLRSNLKAGMFEDPDTTPGGKALKYYASIRVGVYGGKQIKVKISGEEEVVGRNTSVRIKKNKTAPIRKTLKGVQMFFNPDYKVGFDKNHDLPYLLVKNKCLFRKKGSSIFTDKLGKTVARGEEALIKLLDTDPDMRRKLIRRSKINTVSRTREKLESIKKNLYPIENISYTKHNDENPDN